MRKSLLTFNVILCAISMIAQPDSVYRFSLSQAIEFSIENNLSLKNKDMEVRKARWKIWETTAVGLPQINGSVQYKNYPDVPTQLMPNFIMPAVIGVNTQYYGLIPIKPLPQGEDKLPVQFGSEHNADWGISISQLIFSGEYFVGLRASRTYKYLSEQNLEKAKIELKAAVEQAYYLALIAKQSLKILKQNHSNIEKLSENTKKMVEIGVSDQSQADQIRILELNLKNQISALKRQEHLTELMLKFQIGANPQDSIILTDKIEDIIKTIGQDFIDVQFDLKENIDYKLMNTQIELKELEMRQMQSRILPTVTGFYSYSKNAMRNEFDFFDKDKEWFKTSLWGIKLEVPIFSSGQRYAKIQQKRIDVFEAKNQQELIKQQLDIQFVKAKNDFINAYENLVNQQENLNLSEKIYNDAQKKYLQGTTSNMELTQIQNQYLQAEVSYYQTLITLMNLKADIEKLKSK